MNTNNTKHYGLSILPRKLITSSPNPGLGTKAKVIELAGKAQKILELKEQRFSEQLDSEINGFGQMVEEYHGYGILTTPMKKLDELMDACTLIATIFSDIGSHPIYFSKIYNADVNILDTESKFHKTLLGFLVEPQNSMNLDNMKDFIEILAKKHSKDIPEYMYLKKHLDRILEATIYSLNEGLYSVKMDFYDLRFEEYKDESEQ